MKIEVFFFASGFHTVQIDVHPKLFQIEWSTCEYVLCAAIRQHFKAEQIKIFSIKKLE